MDDASPQKGADDPFPRMIIVCAAIALVLLAVILAVLLLDFLSRERAPMPLDGGDARIGFQWLPTNASGPGVNRLGAASAVRTCVSAVNPQNEMSLYQINRRSQ